MVPEKALPFVRFPCVFRKVYKFADLKAFQLKRKEQLRGEGLKPPREWGWHVPELRGCPHLALPSGHVVLLVALSRGCA